MNESVKIIFPLIKYCKNLTNNFGENTSDPHGFKIVFCLKKITEKKEMNKFFDIE